MCSSSSGRSWLASSIMTLSRPNVSRSCWSSRRAASGPAAASAAADGSLAAAGEDHPVPVVRLGEFVDVVAGAALLAPGELRRADRPAQPPVPGRVPGQHQQVLADRVGDTALAGGQAEAELGAEDRAELDAGLLGQLGGRLGELGYPVHAVVVGDGQRFEAAPGRLGDQFGGAGGAVEEAVRRVAVQLRPGRARGCRPELPPAAGSPGPVRAGTGRRVTGRGRSRSLPSAGDGLPSPRTGGARVPATGPAGCPTP